MRPTKVSPIVVCLLLGQARDRHGFSLILGRERNPGLNYGVTFHFSPPAENC